MTIARTLIGSASLAVMCSGCGDDHKLKPADAAIGLDAADATAPDAPLAPGISLLAYPVAVDLTPDGRTALFENFNGAGVDVILYDTIAGVGAVKTTLPDSSADFVTGIAQNGTVAGLYGNPVDGAVWTDAGGWNVYPQKYDPGCDINHSGAFDISDDGTTTTGLLWHGCNTEAFRWTDTGGTGTMVGLQVIGTPSTGFSPSNRGSAISKDGKVIAGFAANGSLDRTPAMWDASGNGTLLIPDLDGTPDTEAPGEVLAMNADGTVVAGILGGEGFVWTPGGLEMMTRLAGTMPGDNVYCNAVTADGRLVFGGVGDNFSLDPPVAFVWSQAIGMRSLTDAVTAAGITLPPNLALQSVFAASDDGTVLIGTAADLTSFYSYVLRVPAGTF